MLVKGAFRYFFIFPVGIEKEKEGLTAFRFPYSLVPLIFYVVLYLYLAFSFSPAQLIVLLCAAVLYGLTPRELKAIVLSAFTFIVFFISLEHFIAYAYGVLAGFIFMSEVYMDGEGRVYLKP